MSLAHPIGCQDWAFIASMGPSVPESMFRPGDCGATSIAASGNGDIENTQKTISIYLYVSSKLGVKQQRAFSYAVGQKVAYPVTTVGGCPA